MAKLSRKIVVGKKRKSKENYKNNLRKNTKKKLSINSKKNLKKKLWKNSKKSSKKNSKKNSRKNLIRIMTGGMKGFGFHSKSVKEEPCSNNDNCDIFMVKVYNKWGRKRQETVLLKEIPKGSTINDDRFENISNIQLGNYFFKKPKTGTNSAHLDGNSLSIYNDDISINLVRNSSQGVNQDINSNLETLGLGGPVDGNNSQVNISEPFVPFKDLSNALDNPTQKINIINYEDLVPPGSDSNSTPLNRYINILPGESAIKVPIRDGNCEGYINANKVPFFLRKYHTYENLKYDYIAAQGPLATTIDDFWRMVWQENVLIIVMVTKITEVGKKKCSRYWPGTAEQGFLDEEKTSPISDKDVTVNKHDTNEYIVASISSSEKCDEETTPYQQHGSQNKPVTGFQALTIKCISEIEYSYYTETKLQISNGTEDREIIHFLYEDWPDQGVPNIPDNFINFHNIIKEQTDSLNEKNKPYNMLVHCSAGVGRTGVFIAINQACAAGPDESGEFKIKEEHTGLLINDMRKYRSNFIQTPNQFEFTENTIADIQKYYPFSKKDIFEYDISNQDNNLHQKIMEKVNQEIVSAFILRTSSSNNQGELVLMYYVQNNKSIKKIKISYKENEKKKKFGLTYRLSLLRNSLH